MEHDNTALKKRDLACAGTLMIPVALPDMNSENTVAPLMNLEIFCTLNHYVLISLEHDYGEKFTVQITPCSGNRQFPAFSLFISGSANGFINVSYVQKLSDSEQCWLHMTIVFLAGADPPGFQKRVAGAWLADGFQVVGKEAKLAVGAAEGHCTPGV